MKLIFLDVDGVLNHSKCEARCPSGAVGIADRHVKQLRNIVSASNAIIILTSTWRHEIDSMTLKGNSPDGVYLVNKLKKAGLHIRGKTHEYCNEIDRYQAIIDWIHSHIADGELEAWCVLDDDIFPGYIEDADFKKRLVKTSIETGLTNEYVDRAIRILNNQFGDEKDE